LRYLIDFAGVVRILNRAGLIPKPKPKPVVEDMKTAFVEFVPILETRNAGDRVFLKSLLDAEGISYYIQGEFVAPYLLNALPMRLMVKKDQAEKVREILQETLLTYT